MIAHEARSKKKKPRRKSFPYLYGNVYDDESTTIEKTHPGPLFPAMKGIPKDPKKKPAPPHREKFHRDQDGIQLGAKITSASDTINSIAITNSPDHPWEQISL